jgi:hypothetical protein
MGTRNQSHHSLCDEKCLALRLRRFPFYASPLQKMQHTWVYGMSILETHISSCRERQPQYVS